MSYLAFDEQRVGLLRSRMGAAVDDLRRIGCPDPEAVAALTAVRSAIVELEQLWLPAVIRVDDCDVLSHFDPTRLSSTDLANAFVCDLASGAGWAVIDIGDAMSSDDRTARITVEEAVAYAEALDDGDIDELTNDPAGRELLAAMLSAASRDPAVAAAFFDTFTKMEELADSLAARRVRLAFDRPRLDPYGTVDQIDAVYRSLAEAYTAANGPNSFPAIDGMDPYSAAQLLRWARLDGPHAAVAGDAILVRQTDGETSLNWLVDKVPGENTTDVVMAVLAATPGSATPYVLLAKDHPETMWWGAADMASVHTVALLGLDPSVIDPREAGAVLHAFVSWFRDEMDPVSSFPGRANPYDSRSFLGELAAPFLILYSPLNATWGITEADIGARKEDLAYLVSDQAALLQLLRRQDYVVAGIDLRGSDAGRSIADVAALIGFLGQIVADTRIDDAQDATDSWDFAWKVVNRIVGQIPGGGQIGEHILKAFRLGVKKVPGLLADAGLSPPSAGTARKEQVEWQSGVAVVTSVALTQALWEQLVSSGRVSADVDGPPSYDPTWKDPVTSYTNAFAAWRRKLPQGEPPAGDRQLLETIKLELVNARDAGQDAAD